MFCPAEGITPSAPLYLFTQTLTKGTRPGDGMVDKTDLKSVGLTAVGVRIPPWAPNI